MRNHLNAGQRMVRPQKQQGCANMPLTLCRTENPIRQTPRMAPFAWKGRTAFIRVMTGLWEARAEPWMCYLLMKPSKATSGLFASGAHFCPVGLFVPNNTVPQLEMHSCHFQVMQLCAKRYSAFTLSPEALVLEYSRIPPWNPPTTPALPSSVCRMLWDVRDLKFCHPGKVCTNPWFANQNNYFLNPALSPTGPDPAGR